MKLGATLAIEEINAAGGINGRMLEAIWEDDAAIPAQSVSAVEKLVNRDQVAIVIGSFNSSNTLANMKVTERERVPHISPVSAAPAVTESGNKWIFRNCAPTPDYSLKLLDWVF